VFPDGKSEKFADPKGNRVMTDGQAYEITRILQMNVDSGTGTAADYGCPAAGKTGTTDEAKDAWFVGYTPKLSTAVWVGYPDAGVAMPGAQGGTYAAPVWHAFMLPAHGEFCDDFPAPTEPFQSAPFVGEYASSGYSSSSSSSDYYYDDYDESGGTSDATGGTGYDPNLYESAPQPEPEVQVPPAQEELAPAPPTEGGGQAAPGDG
jgi:penicillin-binding protein 1A